MSSSNTAYEFVGGLDIQNDIEHTSEMSYLNMEECI